MTDKQQQWARALNIPSTLHRTGQNLSLHAHYERYLAYVAARKRLANMIGNRKKKHDSDSEEADGVDDSDGILESWPSGLPIPTSAEIAQIFVGRSTYYDSWRKSFPYLAKKYPEMVKWLTSQNNCKSDLDLWGKELSVYHFQELLLWIKHGKTLVLKKGEKKGKKGETSNKSHKAKDKGKGKAL